MPFDLQPGEQALFPSPFVPTEQHRLVVTTQRLVRFSADGPFPVGETKVARIDFVGRQTERPYVVLAVIMGLVALLLVIGGAAKVLPAVLQAGANKPATGPVEEVIETGRTKDDDFPSEVEGKEDPKKKLKAGAERLQKLKSIQLGVPQFTTEVILGILMVLGGIGLAFGTRVAFRRQRHLVYCTAEGVVQPLEVESKELQDRVLGAIQMAQQIAKAAGPK